MDKRRIQVSSCFSLLRQPRFCIARGEFRGTVTARDVYLMIAALGYFYLSNRYTLSAFLGERIDTPEAFEHWEAFIVDAVRRAVGPPERLASG